MDTPDELLARILDVAGCTERGENQLRRTARDLPSRSAQCTEVCGGIFEYLL